MYTTYTTLVYTYLVPQISTFSSSTLNIQFLNARKLVRQRQHLALKAQHLVLNAQHLVLQCSTFSSSTLKVQFLNTQRLLLQRLSCSSSTPNVQSSTLFLDSCIVRSASKRYLWKINEAFMSSSVCRDSDPLKTTSNTNICYAGNTCLPNVLLTSSTK